MDAKACGRLMNASYMQTTVQFCDRLGWIYDVCRSSTSSGRGQHVASRDLLAWNFLVACLWCSRSEAEDSRCCTRCLFARLYHFHAVCRLRVREGSGANMANVWAEMKFNSLDFEHPKRGELFRGNWDRKNPSETSLQTLAQRIFPTARQTNFPAQIDFSPEMRIELAAARGVWLWSFFHQISWQELLP